MFSGPPLPLSPATRLSELLPLTGEPGAVGAWLRGAGSTFRFHGILYGKQHAVLASSDLGLLLSRCNRVALREGDLPVVLEVERILEWRALQVVTATPHLPGLKLLEQQFPGLQLNADGLMVPIRAHSPEEVLSVCLTQGVRVAGTRVVYSAVSS
jgi:hypothetical protein